MKTQQKITGVLTVTCMILGMFAVSLADAAVHNPDKTGTEWIAAQEAAITISVVDAATGEPIRGAEVHLKETDATETTNRNGMVTFSELEAGEYSLSVSADGYEAAERSVEIEEDTVELQVTLSPVTTY